jgi:hypothetical protein
MPTIGYGVRVRYVVTGPRGDDLLGLSLGFWGVGGRCTVTRPGGPSLTTRGNWSKRQFSVVDNAGRSVARIVNTSRFFTLRPDSFAFELQAPVLSVVQAIGLAQCLRAAVESSRAASGSVVVRTRLDHGLGQLP